MADELEQLKRELEALKLQLEQERRKNVTADSKPAPESPTSRRRTQKTSTDASSSKEPRVSYVQHSAVGSRRGKWWLRDRQVLSRASVDEDGAATLKVRETWAWSGRTVVLDKIVQIDEEKQQRQQDEESAEEDTTEKADLEVKEPDATKGLPPSATGIVEDAASNEPTTVEQPSQAAETSEPATTNAEEALDSSVGKGEEAPAKADDEVRESSAAESPLEAPALPQAAAVEPSTLHATEPTRP